MSVTTEDAEGQGQGQGQGQGGSSKWSPTNKRANGANKKTPMVNKMSLFRSRRKPKAAEATKPVPVVGVVME